MCLCVHVQACIHIHIKKDRCCLLERESRYVVSDCQMDIIADLSLGKAYGIQLNKAGIN